jgi:hypothetical protein
MSVIVAAIVGVLLVLLIPMLFHSSHQHARPSGPVHYLSPTGSDRAAGSSRYPWRTLAQALRTAIPGERIILRAGVYGRRGQRLVWARSGNADQPIEILGTGRRNRRPVILGYNKLVGNHLVVRDVSFLGPSGPVDRRTADDPQGEDVLVWMVGDAITLQNSEVAYSRWHAGIYVDGGSGERIVNDYVHDNGDFRDPAQANLDQGIYWGGGTSGVISGSVIVRNLANGVQLYPYASGVKVSNNTIAANGRSGVIVGMNASNNRIVDNIVAYNRQNGIRSFSLTGGSNVVENNLVWSNQASDLGAAVAGLKVLGEISAAPRFAGPNDYRLQRNSPAIGRAVTQQPLGSPPSARGAAAHGVNIGAYQGPGVPPRGPRAASG